MVRYRGLLFHDLRTSMARNMRNEGIAEEVIMTVGGWRTSNVFKRYSIVNPHDTAYAVRKVDEQRQRDLAAIRSKAPVAVPANPRSYRVSRRAHNKPCKPPIPAVAD